MQETVRMMDHLVSLIPPRFYLPQEPTDHFNQRFAHNKKNNAPKQSIKESSKKAKKFQSKSTLDILQDQPSDIKPMAGPGSIVELRQKLHDKLAKIQHPKSRQEILERRRLKKAKSAKSLSSSKGHVPSDPSKASDPSVNQTENKGKGKKEPSMKFGNVYLEINADSKKRKSSDLKGQLQKVQV